MEATAISCIHRGIVSAVGLCRDDEDPLIIFKHWNGKNLNSWIWRCKADGNMPPPFGLTGLAIDSSYMPRFKKSIFDIIIGILQTTEFLHSKDILHNDLSTQNIFIHFSKQSNRVYAGIGDWGRSTPAITTLTAIPLRDDFVETKDRARESWPWMALKCLWFRPEPWSKKLDIYSLGRVIKEIVNLIDVPINSPKRALSVISLHFCNGFPFTSL